MRNHSRWLMFALTFLFTSLLASSALAQQGGVLVADRGGNGATASSEADAAKAEPQQETIVLERKSDAQDDSAKTPFGGTALLGDIFAPVESCSGSCSCSTCVCTGSFQCCSQGCGACWDFRDDMGLCGGAE